MPHAFQPLGPSANRLAPLATALLLSACSSGGDGLGSFEVATSRYGFTAPGTLAMDGRWALVSASEEDSLGGTDLNEDGNEDDDVTIALDLSTGAEYNSGVAASAGYILSNRAYLVVDEAEDNDQNDNGIDETVLLTWLPGPDAPTFVAVIDPDQTPVVSGGRLWFNSLETPVAVDESTLRYVEPADPTEVITVLAESGVGSLNPTLRGDQAGLLVLSLDEALNGNQNGDSDADDSAILALLESAATEPRIVPVGLGIVPSGDSVAARLIETGEWNVAFLVDEGQEDANLNGTAPFPLQCSSGPDTDTDDSVLHVLRWEAGGIAAGTNPPLNSQLPGASNPLANRLLLSEEYVGLLSQESSYGTAPGCDLNADGNFVDLVLRWAPLNDPDSPEGGLGLMRQVDVTTPGGALGAIEISDRFVVASPRTVVVEGNPVSANFLAWAEPGISSTFQDNFFDPDDDSQSNPLVIAADWLSNQPSVGRNPVTLLEQSVGLNLNAGCTGVNKDADESDVLPAWLRYDQQSDALIIAGLGWAVQPLNGGVVIRSGVAFFRVSEPDDDVDWNNDDDENDFILFRSPVTACSPTNMGTLNNLPNTPAIYSGTAQGGLFFASESAAGQDLNGDGTIAGLAARFFPF
jgi:hypothetical protein